MKLNRRDIIKLGLMGAGSCFFPIKINAQTMANEHFLYILFLDGGADFTYLFDARPLEMTKAELLSNHIGQEPYLWTGINGGRCLASDLTRKLKPYSQDITIVNGVFMDTNFIGHPNMVNLIFSGSPFGGSSFLPWINTKSSYQKAPLDGIKQGESLSGFEINPHQSSLIELAGKDTSNLIKHLKDQPSLSKNTSAWEYTLSRLQQNAQGEGIFSQGSKTLFNSAHKGADLSEKLRLLDLSSLNTNENERFPDLFSRMAKQKMIRVALETTNSFSPDPQATLYPFDSHAINSPTDHKQMYVNTVDKIESILNFFKSTAYDNTRSMLDVTTIMITSEFGRTMRQKNLGIEESGTDHNIFSNSFIFAGKGIQSGQVIGSSDFQTSGEELSGAHLQLDPDKLNIMAKPFDFNTARSVSEKPKEFKHEHYLTSGSIINTVFDLFGLPKSVYYRKNQGSPAFPSLNILKK